MLDYDVVVVGGGPAGCMAARYAARVGSSTLIVEEDAEIGKPVQCAGLISKRAVEESEIRGNKSFINCEIKGVLMHSHSYELMLESPSQKAFAIKRDVFDKELAREAEKEGAEIILKSRVKNVEKKDGDKRLTITTATVNGEEEIRGTVVIGADGVESVVAKMTGLKVTKGFLNCAQIEGEYETEDAFADIFLGKSIAPGFFAWAIPLGAENRARIGLCIDKRCSSKPNPLLFLKRNLVKHPIIARRYKGARSKFTAGRIPIPVSVGTGWRGYKYNTVMADRESGIILVGDAAAQLKPITGGGVYYGMKCGKIAGEIGAKACLTGDMKLLREYERQWRKEIGKEIAFGLWIHKLRCVMSDRGFDTLLHILSRREVLHHIRRVGDMEYPAAALWELLKNPTLIRLMAGDILKCLIHTKQR